MFNYGIEPRQENDDDSIDDKQQMGPRYKIY